MANLMPDDAGQLSFAVAIVFGFSLLLLVTIGHLRGKVAPEETIIDLWIYQYVIGLVAGSAFIVSIVFFTFTVKHIYWIRDNLEYPLSLGGRKKRR